MYGFLMNELARQEYLDEQYKYLLEAPSKHLTETEMLLSDSSPKKIKEKDKERKDHINEDTELQYIEEEFLKERESLLDLLHLDFCKLDVDEDEEDK